MSEFDLSLPTRRTLSRFAGPVIGNPVENTHRTRIGIVPGHATRTTAGMILWNPIRGRRVVLNGHVPVLDAVTDFRDPVGIARGKPGVLYRSAKLSEATLSDRLTLAGILRPDGLILDLRTRGRSEKEPDPHLPGVRYVRMTLPPTAYVPYADLVLRHKEALRDILHTIATAPGPVLVHCTEGKDRTGIVVALVMFACGSSVDAARREFVRTPNASLSQWERMLKAMCWEIAKPVPQEWVTRRDGLGLRPETVDALCQKVGALG